MNKSIFKKISRFFKLNSINLSFFKLPIKEQMFFAKRLSFLIKAGVPLMEGLHMMKDHSSSKKFTKMMSVILDDIANGQFLSTSLTRFKYLFGDLAINIISVGESAGFLSQNLEYLSEELKKREALRKKVVSAFVYPVVVIIFTLGITLFLMIYLFPKIIPIFSSLNASLPLSTRIVIWVSNFLEYNWLAFFSTIFFVFIVFLILFKKSKSFHLFVDRLIISLPIIGKVVSYYNVANATRTLGLLLKSGLTLNESLPITSRTTKNLVYQKEFDSLKSVINRGEKISSHLKKNKKIFPDVVHQVIAVGEKSGNLSGSLVYLSDFYESEVEDFTKNLSSLIEPILMVFMGVIVGFVAVSIISPIYSITQHLGSR